MSTGELDRLERVERLLEGALHISDQVPVDLPSGRARLAARLNQEHRSGRRTIIAVAASVLAIALATSLVLASLRDHEESLPAPPSPHLTYSPSGLPVGLLVGRVDRTQPGATSTVRLTVRPDGSGVFNAGTIGDIAGDATKDYPVELVRDGPGGAAMTQDEAWCDTTQTLSIEFSVRGRTVVITDARIPSECLVSQGLAADLPGTTMRVRPLPKS